MGLLHSICSESAKNATLASQNAEAGERDSAREQRVGGKNYGDQSRFTGTPPENSVCIEIGPSLSYMAPKVPLCKLLKRDPGRCSEGPGRCGSLAACTTALLQARGAGASWLHAAALYDRYINIDIHIDGTDMSYVICHIYIHSCIYYMCLYICICVYMCICIYIYMCIYVCEHIYIYRYRYIHACTHMYVQMHIYVCIHPQHVF